MFIHITMGMNKAQQMNKVQQDPYLSKRYRNLTKLIYNIRIKEIKSI